MALYASTTVVIVDVISLIGIYYLYPYLLSNPKVMVCSPFSDSFCATGEGIKWGFVPVNFDGKNVQTKDKETFYIYHQWDRTEHAEKIRNNHLNTFSFVI